MRVSLNNTPTILFTTPHPSFLLQHPTIHPPFSSLHFHWSFLFFKIVLRKQLKKFVHLLPPKHQQILLLFPKNQIKTQNMEFNWTWEIYYNIVCNLNLKNSIIHWNPNNAIIKPINWSLMLGICYITYVTVLDPS